jgi:hypothetical protein
MKVRWLYIFAVRRKINSDKLIDRACGEITLLSGNILSTECAASDVCAPQHNAQRRLRQDPVCADPAQSVPSRAATTDRDISATRTKAETIAASCSGQAGG